MRRAHKVDGNQAVIAEALRNAGCIVHVCSRYGGGFPDLLVRGPIGTRYIEVKMPGERGALTKDQREFFGVYFDVYVVCDEAEALEVMGCNSIWSEK